MQAMTENELKAVLSANIKKYRKGKFTQEALAEAVGVSAQNINDIEGKRRWPREATLVKIAGVLDIEVYQLFVPENTDAVPLKKTVEANRLRRALSAQVVAEIRHILNKTLDKIEKKDL